ncbi:uncharacterized protein LOC143286828 isoform X1 [Babylonia areolata]|uniref:uncharacterized protein LOC143286828 isoform X1 n=1 Tax=Babylonia areolata TaxID=304850 RepID=UPI003FD0B036
MLRMTYLFTAVSTVLMLSVLAGLATGDDDFPWSHLFGALGDFEGWARGSDSTAGGGLSGTRLRHLFHSRADKQANNQDMMWYNRYNTQDRKADASEESGAWHVPFNLPAMHRRGSAASHGWGTDQASWGVNSNIMGRGGDSSQEDRVSGPVVHGLYDNSGHSSQSYSRSQGVPAFTGGGGDSAQEETRGPVMHHVSRHSSADLHGGPVMHNVWDTSGEYSSRASPIMHHFWEDSSHELDSGPVFHNFWSSDGGEDDSQEHQGIPVLPWEEDETEIGGVSLGDSSVAGDEPWRVDSAGIGADDFLHQSDSDDSRSGGASFEGGYSEGGNSKGGYSEGGNSEGGDSEGFRTTTRRTSKPSPLTTQKTTDFRTKTTAKMITTKPTTSRSATTRLTTSETPSTRSTARRTTTSPTSTSTTSSPTTTRPRTGTTAVTTTPLPTPFSNTKCQQMMDVVVLVHLSDMKNYQDMYLLHQAMHRLLHLLKVAPNGRHVAVIGYSDHMLLQTPLSGDLALLKPSMQRLKPHPGPANTTLALHHMMTLLHQHGRPGVPKACIVLTDEDSSDGRQAAEQAARARKMGIHMIAVGVGVKTALDLDDLVEDAHHLLFAKTFEDLEDILHVAIFILCPAPDTTTFTTSGPVTSTTNRRSPVTTASVKTPTVPRPTTTQPTQTVTVSTTPRTVSTLSRTSTPHRTTTISKTTYPTFITNTISTIARSTAARSTPVRSTTTMTLSNTSSRTSSTAMTTTTTAPRSVPAVCDDCSMVNGVGYKAHWAHCDLFIQCHFLADGTVSVLVKQCPHGLHWHQSALTCTRPSQAACTMDPCRQDGYSKYLAINNCRGYWVCQSGRSEGKCCPPGHSFSGRIGCVPDIRCQDPCGVSPFVPPACDKRPVPKMPLTFEQYVPGAGWKKEFCAPGTAYNHSNCACTDLRAGPTDSNSCRAELYLPFKGDVKDESGNNNFVQNEGVKVINGAGYFDGSSVLRVPRFANADYGDYVLIRLRYKQEAGGGGRQALVANGDCLKPSSLYMVAGPEGVSFGAQTTTGKNASITVSSNTGGWKEAVMYVDRHTLTGSVNNFSMQTLFTGSLATSKCALQIGRGTNFHHFKGFMDDITVFLCRPKTF